MLAWRQHPGAPRLAYIHDQDVPAGTVDTLKALARRNGRSMEQEVRELLDRHTAERQSVPQQIEGSWAAQTRRPTAEEIDRWIEIGRS